MGLTIHASVLCDNCNVVTTDLSSVDAPLPESWMRVQGYANISAGTSDAIIGYFCPTCVGAVAVKDLVKKAADVSPDLTQVAA